MFTKQSLLSYIKKYKLCIFSFLNELEFFKENLHNFVIYRTNSTYYMSFYSYFYVQIKVSL